MPYEAESVQDRQPSAAVRPAIYPDLAEHVALITGAGSGIGRATAIALAASGVRVAVTELPGRSHHVRATAEAIEQHGGAAFALELDVRRSFAARDVVHRAADRFGRLDILVNNAGIQHFKPALEVDEELFDELVSVNLRGAFFCAQAAASIMIEAGGGAIVNVASQHGVIGNRDRAPYCASKGGLISLTRALAIEWAPHKIRVNAVSPTFTVNESNRGLLEREALQHEIQRHIPLQRPATSAEVAASICFLASAGAAMITGHNLLIDGGWTAG
ncbi:MAG TPA: glucose 1-dehydrogenase [Polyangiales bacterium]|nr:glucose 1-dehydrogenase [Polyangiales bacterium]